MSDLTIIFLTLNKLPEEWTEYHLQTLKEAVGDCPVISISREPMDFGTNLIQEETKDKSNIFRQILRGAKLAQTKYIAIAEDDTLYPPEHFKLRPKGIGYNMHRWWLHTWGEPVYSTKIKHINSTMIGNRELVIAILERRFREESNELKLATEIEGEIQVEELYSNVGVVQFDHDYFFGNYTDEDILHRHTKRPKPIKATEIPFWGRASDLRNKFK